MHVVALRRDNENGSGFAGDALGFTHTHTAGVAERYKLMICSYDFEFGSFLKVLTLQLCV